MKTIILAISLLITISSFSQTSKNVTVTYKKNVIAEFEFIPVENTTGLYDLVITSEEKYDQMFSFTVKFKKNSTDFGLRELKQGVVDTIKSAIFERGLKTKDIKVVVNKYMKKTYH